jgi:hypothetical protein
MQIYLFYHLVMKSTINRPKRDDDFCFTGPVSAWQFLIRQRHAIAVCGVSGVTRTALVQE